ncbi:hypothetical protein BJI49_13375 [Acetobacter pasteurianus]|nr:DUF4747 family protein [Acetobacter pasteurianus]RCL04421.1 hypothetical protein BJI49_13375 [Acetobacter pasteurianus]GCD50340.1 cytoplasmic protein [Acetobacter pasteurianus subsp. pasteurianus LMG 1262 = NBRC 106471]
MVKIKGDACLIFTQILPSEENIFGTIGKFTKIDFDKAWLDIQKMDSADENTLKLLNIPPYLQPNYESFYFLFDLYKHMFYYERKVSPNFMQKFLSILFSNPEIIDEFGEIGVSIIQSEEALEEIFSLVSLTNLEIRIFRPNPDDCGNLDDIMMGVMENSGASQVRFGATGSKKTGLKVTEGIKNLGQLALEHGDISAKGYDTSDKLVKKSSKEHPIVEKIQYKSESAGEAFQNAVYRMSRK